MIGLLRLIWLSFRKRPLTEAEKDEVRAYIYMEEPPAAPPKEQK